MFSLGMVGAGQFAGTFAKLFRLHPAVSEVRVTDLLPNRAEELAERENIGPAVGSFEEMLGSDVDSPPLHAQPPPELIWSSRLA